MSAVNRDVGTEPSPSFSAKEALSLVELADAASRAQNLDDLGNLVLPPMAELMCSSSVLLYVADSRLSPPEFLPYGIPPRAASEIEHLCSNQFEQIASGNDLGPTTTVPTHLNSESAVNLVLHPLQTDCGCCGLLGLVTPEKAISLSPKVLERLLSLLSNTIDRLVARAESDRQLAHLNTYLTVSSMLVQSELNLHDLLEGVLYCCMDAVSAEAASVLLLDDDMTNFRFYHVEGPSKPGLKDATLPADEGIAGYVLRTGEPVVISDAHTDPRFYQKFDSESGFRTRSMIAIPLVTGEEPIGVLEVLNKIDAASFTEDEQMLLLSIAEEIAFAIRNAKMFEFVANSYCKQRQGATSCRGCDRPLGAWTPCIQYRKTVVSGLWRISDMPDFGSS
jgi:GAF domain-containing protein